MQSFLKTILLALLCTNVASAQEPMPKEDVIDVPAIGEGLSVHNLFQSNMVLQRDRPIRIWGWAAQGDILWVSLGDVKVLAVGQGEEPWVAEFPALSASSEPIELVVSGGVSGTVRLNNILIGDVWLLGGQSNMEFPLERVDNGWLEIVSARFDQIRVLTVPAPQGPEHRESFPRLHEWSGWFNRHFRKGDWDVLSPEIAFDLSAIGYAFARRVHMATQVPIGIVDVSRGGTTVETWIPEEVLRGIDTPEVRGLLQRWDERIANWDPGDGSKPGPAMDMNRPGTCYSSMIHPIAGLAVKGAIFHQGFNNANGGTAGAAMYRQLFGEVIRAWRAAFDDPDMPFGIISLCTEGPRQTEDNFVEMMLNDGIYIREAQYQTYLDFVAAGDQNIGFASSFDKRRGWYHPQLKIPVGERISRWALATQYGFERRIRWKPPTYTKMETGNGQIVLHMDGVVSAEDNQAAIHGFAIAGEDRRFHPAQTEWMITGKDRNNRPQRDRKILVLSSPHVAEPIHFRYAWGRNPMANLQSADHNDLPFATQRSDDWDMSDVPLGVLNGEDVPNNSLTRAQRNRIRAALRAEDLWRRIAEAKALLKKHGESLGAQGR